MCVFSFRLMTMSMQKRPPSGQLRCTAIRYGLGVVVCSQLVKHTGLYSTCELHVNTGWVEWAEAFSKEVAVDISQRFLSLNFILSWPLLCGKTCVRFIFSNKRNDIKCTKLSLNCNFMAWKILHQWCTAEIPGQQKTHQRPVTFSFQSAA